MWERLELETWTLEVVELQYRFEFKSSGARNNALKLLEKNGFDYDLMEDPKGYVVKLPKSTPSMRRS